MGYFFSRPQRDHLSTSVDKVYIPSLCSSPGGRPTYAALLISCHSMESIKTTHSVESPSMLDPQWNIWYWGSKWNLHTVCWSAVGGEWGTTSVYFGITHVGFIPRRLPVFAVEPQYLLQYFFIFVKSIIWITHTKIFKTFHVGLKFEWGL